ncbi:hypothetical protein C8D92_102150 [Tamilnaduibacter salinus]|uniref:ABC transporter substrate-binding protein n=1 Tax=Tamilnaduibacter salinus TaxID=1484056 RepID=A0A2U1CZM7_9GAMM|nr:hypothetical protein C8D92_102150 [Tamilnaduibacter salinus]
MLWYIDRAHPILALLLVILLITAVIRPAVAQSMDDAGTNAPHTVYLVGTDNEPFNQYFLKLLEQRLGTRFEVRPYDEDQTSDSPAQPVVTLDANALDRVLDHSSSAPVLALMLTRRQFERRAQTTDRPLTAIFGNPPLIRQALLGREILPQSSRVAVLAQSGRAGQYEGLLERLRHYDMEAEVFTVSGPDRLVATLNRALQYGDFLLGTTDPAIYNRQTIKPILLTTYRNSRILIGPEKAFVRAGALASTYTSMKTYARIAATRLREWGAQGGMGDSDYPDDFLIRYNRQVARSLNIPLPEKADVIKALRQTQTTAVDDE